DKRFHELLRRSELPPRSREGPGVLRKAGAAEAGAGQEKAFADAPVKAYSTRHVCDVAAGFLAKICDIVDEADLERQKGVCRVLYQLGIASRRDDHGYAGALKGAVNRPQDIAGARIVRAKHDAVRFHEVFHRGALTQELGVGSDADVECSTFP